MTSLRALFLTLALVPAVSGCISARLTAPHQAYAPLLDHAGQVDVVARVGAMSGSDTTAAGQIAFSPTENFELAASVDGDWSTEGNATAHLGGGFALGVYSSTEIFRAEVLVGANGGLATGDGTRCDANAGDGCAARTTFSLAGPYLQPFVQGLIGFEIPYFELAGGMRLFAHLADVSANGTDGTSVRTGYERVYLEQIVTIRVPIEFLRFEVVGALPFVLGGDTGPLPTAIENWSQPYVTVGLGVQFDTMGAVAR